jgi:hypothetical protein
MCLWFDNTREHRITISLIHRKARGRSRDSFIVIKSFAFFLMSL